MRHLSCSTDIFGRYRSLGGHCDSYDENMHDYYLGSKRNEEKELCNI